ncbi:PadR family transcriptional regulator [Aeromicrobium sp. CF3.5]|uniref:PadR family transcriptional regulator n=1 Tax=Aeromicrobium sp. CF3.5 TaxID=3373078 RepID=UPI003EE6588C
MSSDNLPTEWLRAVLPLATLAIVAEEETYGYAVGQRLQAAGLGTIKGGTLYPILNRLEADELLTSSWREGVGGPGRKFFAVTEQGRAHLDARAAAWASFTERAAGLLPHTRSAT